MILQDEQNKLFESELSWMKMYFVQQKLIFIM
jgi:hypothetical protein